jgi:hypothetical protein
MHNPATAFSDLTVGMPLGRLELAVSRAANDRYWQAAGVEHPALRAGALYPPIAANLTVLLFGQVCPDPVIQTTQGLRCHRRALAPATLVATGYVTARYDKRGRDYADLAVAIHTADEPDLPLWDATVTFTPAATFGAPR